MFAAHISADSRREQSVHEHCRNTAELCAGYCKIVGAENIGRLAGLLHDAGKLCNDFDNYIRGISRFSRGEIDHSYAGAKYITENTDKVHAGVSRLIARVIISHHGLHDWVDENCKDYFKSRIANDKNYGQIKQNILLTIGADEFDELLKKAADEYRALCQKIKNISKTPTDCAFYLGLLERFLESALIDADRTDTASFMDDAEYSEYSAVPELWQSMKNNMEKKLAEFSERTDVISEQRKSISDRCADFAKNDVKICRLIVPTGGGKTLSSLRFAIEYCLEHGMEKIVYTAPFMSILEQNGAEIKSIAGEDNFIEHHSNALTEKSDNSEELSDYELHTERWDKPVIATTMVQFLNALFLGKSASVRRFHRIAKSVIIIDEVQSIPLKCLNMFDLAVNFLSHICKAAVVLCTATQPVTDDVRHPMLMDENESMTGDYQADFEVFRRTEIIPHIDPYGYSYEEAADFCADKFTTAGDLLVIVNTKSSALKMYDLIRNRCGNDADVVHLSTNMCPQHRRDKIKAIRKLLGEKKSVICVTTQLIEAGVDISFRCVVRSLAGLDSAVQAAGRCNRHGESIDVRPVYLIKLKEEKLGNLKEISTAQDITQHMAESGEYTDISSPEAVSDYFVKLYQYEKDKLSYSVPVNETLVNYLSLNKKRYEMLPDPKPCSKFESQAFKTAGKLFQVIDENTRDVIVPYNEEAQEIISRLENSNENISVLLRKAQKYTVSIYIGTERKLYENNALSDISCGAVILDSSHYNNEFGIDIERAEKEILIF
ncbi:MAG: CRISPR-associated helicase Cas3' [Oscillospiraceae bacterium]|nr:CRISPR-associated helicase Cas3' [Oscillospiraceae bacterium]